MTTPDPAPLCREAPRDGDLTRHLDEQLLVERVRAGDPLAFEVIFRRYHAELTAVAAWVLGSSTRAEDVVQDVFLAVWTAREHWQISTSVRAYLRRAARNMALRHASRAAERDHHEIRPELAAPSTSPDERLDAAAMAEAAARAAASLPPRAREVYGLSRGDGLSTREIAERLDISPKTVELHLTRALGAIRTALARWRGA